MLRYPRANILPIAINGAGQVAGENNFCIAAGESTCSVDYGTANTTITLAATANAGFGFDGWGGECASAGTSPSCRLVVIGFSDDVGIPVQNVSASFRHSVLPSR